MALWADHDDMIARYDVRTVGQWLSDTGTPVDSDDFDTDTRMQTALKSATGKAKASLLKGERYTIADITNMGDNTHADYDEESSEYLKTLVCALALWEIYRAKPQKTNDSSARKEAKKEYEEALELLSSGQEIFNVPTVVSAGKPQVETVTRSEIQSDWSLFVDEGRGRFFPARRSYRNR